MPESSNHPQRLVYGLPIQELPVHVWYDGFLSGASTACSQFLPDAAAETKADQLTEAATESCELQAQVRCEVADRMREWMAPHMQSGSRYPGRSHPTPPTR